MSQYHPDDDEDETWKPHLQQRPTGWRDGWLIPSGGAYHHPRRILPSPTRADMNDDDEQPRMRRQAPALQATATQGGVPIGPSDFRDAHDSLGAMCGHGSFAAALGMTVRRACEFFPDLNPKRGWVNLPEMEAALRMAERNGAIEGFHSTRDKWPCQHGRFGTGLVIVQWLGSWLDEGVPPAAACRQTHWLATQGGWVFDINIGEWCSLPRWEQELEFDLRRALSPRSTGWRIKKGYEIAKH